MSDCGCKIEMRYSDLTLDPEYRIAYCPLHAAAEQLRDALVCARSTILAWHGDDAWSLYQQSPEMKQINSALAAAEKKVKP